ncbi:FmdB family zinc ribbon protein [Streptomyces sp. RFCAC02]|uniref:FmdB family zinc ribbon protein n=1 Tax=Streptomyces sp. RFCAC02 TaxID=2499143 RepID=UPI00101FB6F5|nr:FmdB family zinc ribbon protein [Streptomyces sp. RFCAC02]
MPTYQYQCTACNEGLEVVQKFTDDALTVCPSCQGRLKKVFSAVGIVFKGSGFYRNDSRNATSSSSPASSSKPEKKADGGSSSAASGSTASASSSSSSASTSSSTSGAAASAA